MIKTIYFKGYGLCQKKNGKWAHFWPKDGIEWIQCYTQIDTDTKEVTMKVEHRPDPRLQDKRETFKDIGEGEYYVMSVLLPELQENARKNKVSVHQRIQSYTENKPMMEADFILNYLLTYEDLPVVL